jgi:hypothetical protein
MEEKKQKHEAELKEWCKLMGVRYGNEYSVNTVQNVVEAAGAFKAKGFDSDELIYAGFSEDTLIKAGFKGLYVPPTPVVTGSDTQVERRMQGY